MPSCCGSAPDSIGGGRRVWAWRDTVVLYHDRVCVARGLTDAAAQAFTLDAPRAAAVTRAFVELHERGLIHRCVCVC